MNDRQVQPSTNDIPTSLVELGITEDMIMQGLDSNYVWEALPLLLFGSLYYLVLTVVHLATGVGAAHSLLAVLTGTISLSCFGGRWLLKNGHVGDHYTHLMAVVLLLGLIAETYSQIWMGESTEPIAEIVIAIMIAGILLIARWAFLLVSLVLLCAFLLTLIFDDAFHIYYERPYVLLLIAVAFSLSAIIFMQRRRGVLRNIKLHLIDQQRNVELVNANAAKNQFLSSMSHELRTPLNAIIGFSQLMEVDSQIPQKNKIWIGHILNASEHLLYLISQVLNLAKIESEHIEINREIVVAEKLIDYAISMTENLTADKKIEIIKNVDPDLHELHCHTDPKAMHQVLLNLLGNAIKYNRPGGEVTISLKKIDGEKIGICIADTGLGIPADQQQFLFQPFNRLGREKSSISGTGIGLAITLSLCEAMDVELEFESEENVGSTFVLAVPGVAPAASEHSS